MRVLGLGVVAVALFGAGCAVPVEVGLDDGEANRVFLALDRAGVDATKEQDPTSEGRWRISVAREDVARALVAMKDEGVPRGEPAADGKVGLVPSEAAEEAQRLGAIAAHLRSSLESIDGVLGARVHLAAPERAAGLLRDAPVARGSASVLFEYRGATPPVSADSVQRLVAGAVAGLAASDVSVVMVPCTAPAAPSGGVLGHVGPIAVARSSMATLKIALLGLVSLAALFAGAVLLLYARLAKAQASAAEAEDRRAANEGPPDGGRGEHSTALGRGVS